MSGPIIHQQSMFSGFHRGANLVCETPRLSTIPMVSRELLKISHQKFQRRMADHD